MNENDGRYDVIVVGGGAAGLSAALMLSRARRRVLVLDDGSPRNAPAQGVHNWLTRDGLPPAEIGRIGRAEVTGYGGVVRDARVTAARATEAGVVVTTADGDDVEARALLVTTGLTDEIPPVPGLTERWGAEVFGCPFCHAWEHRDSRIAVLSTGPHDLMKAHLARLWSDDVWLFLHTGPEPDERQWAEFAARGVTVVDGEVTGAEVGGDRLAALRLASGVRITVDAVTVSPRARARAGFLDGLGLAPVEHPSGLGDAVPAGPDGRTAVPGVWATGNVTDPLATVPAAVAAGAAAASGIICDLVLSDVDAAVRAVSGAEPSAPAWSDDGSRDAHRSAPAAAASAAPVGPSPGSGTQRSPAAVFSAAGEGDLAARVAGDRVHGLVP